MRANMINRGTGRLWAASGLVTIILAALALGRAPIWLLAVYAGLGLVAASLYYADKHAARVGAWRVSERTLHTVDLFGGIVGGLVAQQVFRHKTMKLAYRQTTWTIAALHAAALLGLAAGAFGQFDPGAIIPIDFPTGSTAPELAAGPAAAAVIVPAKPAAKPRSQSHRPVLHAPPVDPTPF